MLILNTIKLSFFVLTLLLLSVSGLYADGGSAGPATFAGSYTLWTAVIVGFVASVMTIFYAIQMRSSVVGYILGFFGTGMLLVVLGFFVVVVEWATEDVQMIVHDLLFIAGYLLILLAVFKVRKLGA